jgi:glycosyltransferase involved in cell wall biosynthesis
VFSAAHFSFVIAPTPALLLARCWRRPAVLHYHSGDAGLHLQRWGASARITMRLAATIVVPSRYLMREFARHGLPARRIPNFIEPERLRFRARSGHSAVFLSNRQLLPVYGVDCVLRAFALVQRRVPHASLIVAADGGQGPSLRALARELGLRNTSFLGWVPPERIAELYDAADIYLNGSLEGDNVPVSILEAYAAGLPVVSTDPGGISELVTDGETGLLVPAGDHVGLAAAALRVLDERALASRLAANGRRRCSEFTWSERRGEWLALYQELVATRLT